MRFNVDDHILHMHLSNI